MLKKLLLFFLAFFLLNSNTVFALNLDCEENLDPYCYIHLVQSSLDVTDCEPLKKICAEPTDDCYGADYTHCVWEVARRTENITDCEPLKEICSELTDACYRADYAHCVWIVARETENLELCFIIPPNVRKADRTFPYISVKDYCQAHLMEIETVKDCKKIWDQYKRASCFSNHCEEKECCEHILEEEEITEKIEISEHDYFSAHIEEKYHRCWANVAKKSNNLLACIEAQNYNCLPDKADIPINLDPIVCDGLKQDEVKAMCYGRFAFIQDNLSLCENKFADNHDLFRKCVSQLEYSNIEMCEEFNDDEIHDFCVSMTISKTHNADYCNNHRNENKQEICINNTGRGFSYFPFNSTSKFIDSIIGGILFLVLFIAYLIKRKQNSTTITKPLIISMIYLVIARAIILIPTTNSFDEIFIFTKPLRVFDLIGLFTAIKRYIPYNWMFFLFFDLLVIAVILFFGYLIEKKKRTRIKKIGLYSLLLGLMLIQSYALGYILVMAISSIG